MNSNAIHYGIISIIPAIIALGLAIKSKRVIESLLIGILSATMIIDGKVNGVLHSILYSITNLFKAIVGHPSTDKLRGVGIMRGADRGEVILVVLLLGAFITILEKSGGAYAFGKWLSEKVKTKKGAQNATGIMGCALFTSAYFSSLATGTVFKPIYDRMNISREKLAFILDSTSAPINTIIPISGWVAYMGSLMADNIPGVDDPIKGLTATIPYNFYCIVMLIMVFLFANNVIKDYGPMKKAEERMLDKHEITLEEQKEMCKDMKNGKVSDMLWPLGTSIMILIVLGLWNYTIVNFFDVPEVPFGGNQMLILSFSVGMIVAFVKYVSSKIMTAKEFLDMGLEGTKSAIIGGMIIILAVTLGDLMRASAPEGLGTALYLGDVAKGIPSAIIPCIVFILGGFMGFSMGTSWGVWGILIPISIPLTLATGGNPYLVAAAVLSGGTFGDHCSPISDTTIMSSIGAGCDHIEHVNTQLPYALTAAGISAALFLLMGFIV